MNILIPHTWLLEHLDTQATPEQIAEYVSLCGPTIEYIIPWSPEDAPESDTPQEVIYDIEVTTNRVDAMSVRGIARECATILPEFGIDAKLKSPPFHQALHQAYAGGTPLDIRITNDSDLNHRILGIKLSNLTIGPSPQWLQDRLKQVGQRSLNNIIDITNYTMFEYGHPIHAFDYDAIAQSGQIIVREAKAGETFTTLDDKTYTCLGGEVVFDDGNGTIIDLPGIMGTKNTVVTDDTQNVLLWIESVDAKKIRYASMTHGIRTQAAVLNEKDVDPNLADNTILRAIQLYQDLCNATIDSHIYDDFPIKPERITTQLSHPLLESYLGISIEPTRVKDILQKLDCEVEIHPDSYSITPPTFRSHDLQIPQDYIEEIARIYGYHKLPSNLMATTIPDRTSWRDPEVVDSYLEQHLKQLLAGFGLTEVYTYSLINQQQAQTSEYPLEQHLKLKNPLSDDHVYLRRSLTPSHLTFLQDNAKHDSLAIFELAKTYQPLDQQTSQLPNERLDLLITSTHGYPHLKGILDALAQKLHLDLQVLPATEQTSPTLPSSDLWIPTNTAIIHINTPEPTSLGHIGQLNTEKPTFACYLDVQTLLHHANLHPSYQAPSGFTPIIQDFTFTLPEHTHIAPILDSITNLDPLIETCHYLGSHQQNHSIRLEFASPTQQLTDEQVQPVRQKIQAHLQEAAKSS